MKKYYKFIFMLLFGFFVFMPKNTFAFDLAIPTTYGGQGFCNVSGGNCYEEQVASSTSSLYNGGYTSQWYSSGADYSWIVYDFGNIAYCSSDSTLTISGTLYSRNPFNLSIIGDNPIRDVTAYMNSSTRTQCSYFYSNNVISYSCSGKGGGNLAFIFSVHGPDPATDFLLTKNVNLSCGASNGDIITSNNQNSQNIINNNNSNTNKILEQEKKLQEEQQKTNDKLDKAEDTRKGIWETIKELPSKFLDMLLGLFIPDDMSFLDNFRESLENKLGFIAEVPLSILDFLFNLVSSGWDEFNSITLPSIEMFGVSFWNSQDISLQEAIDIFSPYKYVTDVICVILCVNTLRKWYESFASGGVN